LQHFETSVLFIQVVFWLDLVFKGTKQHKVTIAPQKTFLFVANN
jgi:hypothetical protein